MLAVAWWPRSRVGESPVEVSELLSCAAHPRHRWVSEHATLLFVRIVNDGYRVA